MAIQEAIYRSQSQGIELEQYQIMVNGRVQLCSRAFIETLLKKIIENDNREVEAAKNRPRGA